MLPKKPDIITRVEFDCPICGKRGFTLPEKATTCRDLHTLPVKILNGNFGQERILPGRIQVEFPNGFIAAYELTSSYYYAISKCKEFERTKVSKCNA